MTLKIFFAVILCIITCNGCVKLKHVGEFSKTSVEGLAKYETVSTGFSKICHQDCEQKHIQSLNILRIDCDCEQDEKADSITHVIYNATKAYFYGLSDLSQNKLTKYNTDDFTQALSTGDFGPLKLNEADVNAYSNISTFLPRAFADGYRRNKVKEYVAQAHEPCLHCYLF